MKNPSLLGLGEPEPQLRDEITIESLAQHASDIESALQSEQAVLDLPELIEQFINDVEQLLPTCPFVAGNSNEINELLGGDIKKDSEQYRIIFEMLGKIVESFAVDEFIEESKAVRLHMIFLLRYLDELRPNESALNLQN